MNLTRIEVATETNNGFFQAVQTVVGEEVI